MPGLTTLASCPYCPRTGVGKIAIDPDAAAHLALARPGGFDSHSVAAGDPAGVLVFNPDGRAGSGPCPHVVALLIDVEVGPPRSAAVSSTFVYTGVVDHPTFDADEFGRSLSEFLWDEVNGGDEPAFHPTTPFSIEIVDETLHLPRLKWEVRVPGTIFLAMDPEAFVSQLRERYLAAQAFAEREQD